MLNLFKALSDETRLRILSVIFQGEMCVCEIEQSLGLTQSNASRHITVLKNAGIIKGVKRAQWMYCSLDECFIDKHKELFEYLSSRLTALDSYAPDTEHRNDCIERHLCN